MRRPYFVCGGLQDNNAWGGPGPLANTTGTVNPDWFSVGGGDGFYTRQDPTDWAIVYAESQDGNMTRHDLRAGTQKSIRPNAGGGRGAAGGPPPAPATPSDSNAPAPAGSEGAGPGRGGVGGGTG